MSPVLFRPEAEVTETSAIQSGICIYFRQAQISYKVTRIPGEYCIVWNSIRIETHITGSLIVSVGISQVCLDANPGHLRCNLISSENIVSFQTKIG